MTEYMYKLIKCYVNNLIKNDKGIK